MRWDETWHRLRIWTAGSAASERLAAQVLLQDGFTALDPSHPLGGPDGRYDAVAWRGNTKWIMAVYFPNGPRPFAEVRRKFRKDVTGLRHIDMVGIAFVTNQELSIGQRRELTSALPMAIELYHLERLVTILDQPHMQSVRAQYLGIPSSDETDSWSGYTAPAMPDGWPRIWIPPEDAESRPYYDENPDDPSWKFPRECTCGEVFTTPETEHEGFQGSWGDGREYLEGAIPDGLDEADLFNPIVWHWLNLLWDVAEANRGESFAAFQTRRNWFRDKRDRREFVQAMEEAQAEFDIAHPEHAGMLRWRKPWT